MTALPVINVYHTTEMTHPCCHATKLRHEGKTDGRTPGALYCGLLGHEALQYVHENDAWDDLDAAMDNAADQVSLKSIEENRPYTPAVLDGLEEHTKNVRRLVTEYVKRLRGYFSRCELIGCELPVSYTITGDHEPIVLGSHVDLLFRDPGGLLCCWDWKFREEQPSMAYLTRNMQFVIYHLVMAYGQVQVDAALDLWNTYGEHAQFAWVDMPRFKPYGRKTTVKAGDEEIVYEKGDTRPLEKIVRAWMFDPEKEDAMVHEIVTRATMYRQGLFPKNPGTHCQYCDSERYCDAYDRR